MFFRLSLVLPVASNPCFRSGRCVRFSALFCWFLLFCVGQSALLFVLVLASSSWLHFRVDLALADGAYELVQEQEQQQQAPTQFQFDPDPSQVSEEPKAAEGKHRSMVPYLKLFYAPTVTLLVHLRFQVLFETLVAFSLGNPLSPTSMLGSLAALLTGPVEDECWPDTRENRFFILCWNHKVERAGLDVCQWWNCPVCIE